MPALLLVVPAESSAQPSERIDFLSREVERRLTNQRLHEPVDVLQFFERRPADVACFPERVRRQPDGEGFRKVLIGMALRVPRVEMEHETLAVGLGRIVVGIRLRALSEELLPMPPATQAEGVLDGMPCLVPQDAHARLRIAAFHFQHLGQFELGEPGMGEVERNPDAGHIIRTEPFIGQPKMGTKAKAPAIEFLVQLRDTVFHIAARDFDIKVAQPKIQQLFIRPRDPIGEIVSYAVGGRIGCRLALVLTAHRSGTRSMDEKRGHCTFERQSSRSLPPFLLASNSRWSTRSSGAGGRVANTIQSSRSPIFYGSSAASC